MTARILQGDCREVLRTLPAESIDSIVTDPPYGLGKEPDALAMLADWLGTGHHDVQGTGFMGKAWDAFVPQPALWRECLRVLKPGGHLLAFAGTRTHDLMTLGLRIAGFEIRDTIMWVYGSGFPKSLDVSKAIDRAAGKLGPEGQGFTVAGYSHNPDKLLHTAPSRGYVPPPPATPDAERWQGWGTALKPALETVTFASKPYTQEQERDIILSNLIRLEARLWLLSSASAVEKSSTSNQSEYDAACAIAQWNADEITNTRADLCGQMDTSLFELATTTSLSIVSSWRRTLGESWSDGSMSTTETKSSTTIDLRTLKFSLLQITPSTIIRACSLPGGFSANASTAESHFNASLSLLQSIRTLSVTEIAISQAQHEHLGAGVKPNLDPCIMARKPLSGTVASNVLAWGTGGLNIDGCRVSTDDKLGGGGEKAETSAKFSNEGWKRPWMDDPDALEAQAAKVRANVAKAEALGRWPANLIHDGSSEVLEQFPNSNGAGGSAARFFYCAKASKRDRDEGLEGFEVRPTAAMAGNMVDGQRLSGTGQPIATPTRANHHPTVKPSDLMAYLCRLVTPPGGVVLDPFMGSGSTGKAAMLEGFAFIGCELSADYIAIANTRIADAQREANEKREEAAAKHPDLFAKVANA